MGMKRNLTYGVRALVAARKAKKVHPPQSRKMPVMPKVPRPK